MSNQKVDQQGIEENLQHHVVQWELILDQKGEEDKIVNILRSRKYTKKFKKV